MGRDRSVVNINTCENSASQMIVKTQSIPQLTCRLHLRPNYWLQPRTSYIITNMRAQNIKLALLAAIFGLATAAPMGVSQESAEKRTVSPITASSVAGVGPPYSHRMN
jgi:hypothetical protein